MAMTDYEAALKHRYRVEAGGESVPGVTSIIGVIEVPGLKWASSGIAAETAVRYTEIDRINTIDDHRAWLLSAKGKTATAVEKRTLGEHGSDDEVFIHFCRGEFDRQWRAKAERGSRVHEVAELWSAGKEVDVIPEDSGFVDALEQFHLDYSPEFVLVECIVLNTDLAYGGRFDGVVRLDGPGASGLFLIDYKTGGEYPWPCAMQAEGYRRSRLASYDDDGRLDELTDLPEVDGARTIYLREDGTIKVSDPFEMIDREEAWEAFVACRSLYEINKRVEKRLNAAAKEATTTQEGEQA